MLVFFGDGCDIYIDDEKLVTWEQNDFNVRIKMADGSEYYFDRKLKYFECANKGG